MTSPHGWWGRTWQTLYGKTAVAFPSRYPLEESIRRLHAALDPGGFQLFRTREGVVGKVAADKVYLRHARLALQNSWESIFVGNWQQRPDEVILAGHFQQRRVTELFQSFWLAFALIWTAAALLVALYGITKGSYAMLLMPLGGGLIFAFGYGLAVLGRKLAVRDETFMTDTIRRALSE